MRFAFLTAVAAAAAVASVASSNAALARTQTYHGRISHHHAYRRGEVHAIRRGLSPAYAPPAPIGVGLFGTGLFYGYGFPEPGTLGF